MPAGAISGSFGDYDLGLGYTTKRPPIGPTALFGNPSTFTAAANTQASDYDKIMKSYADLVNRNPITSTNVTPQIISPQTASYSQSPDVTGSLSNLSNLATTGGYSDADIQNIRERDISPIRSIYANAQQNVERQRALSGGYSPNFNAVQDQMARDESSQIGDRTTAVNAGIAQNVAQNRLVAASPYASASSNANAAKTESDRVNAEIVNQINQANANRSLEAGTGNANRQLETGLANRQGAQGAIQGQASLYGTTPALVNTFGNQVIQAGQMGQGQQQINNQKQRNIFDLAR